MALFEFKLPDLGEGVVEGEIVGWLVKPGDVVKEDQVLVELMTDKATVTVPTPRAGRVVKTYGNVGELAKVHHPLVDLELDAAAPAAPASSPQTPVPPAPPAAVVARPNGEASPPAQRVAATPVTRRMAREHGLDLSTVAGSGPGGRVLKSDVEAYLRAPAAARPAAPAPLPTSAQDQRLPLRGLRKRIAEKMVKSKFTAPHYHFVEELDATPLVALRSKLNAGLSGQGEALKLSYLPFFVKAVLGAFRRFPQVNAVMDEAAQELVVRGERNIGIAAMTEQGLTVPVIRHADRLSFRAMAQEISRLAAAARDQKLSKDELTQGTFTVTSLGQTGGLFATPILNHPEVAILGVHQLKKRPVVLDDDTIAVRTVVNLSFGFDHRVIDGATGAEFAYEVLRFLATPELLFLD